MVYTERAEMAVVSRSTSHVTNQTALSVQHIGGDSKHAVKSYSHSFGIACDKSPLSLLDSREQRKIGAILLLILIILLLLLLLLLIIIIIYTKSWQAAAVHNLLQKKKNTERSNRRLLS